VGFIEVKEADCETCAGGGKERAETSGFTGVAKVQHSVDRVRGMTWPVRTKAACAVSEWAAEPRREGSASARSLEPRPGKPCQGAPYSLYNEDGVEFAGVNEAAFKVAELGFSHAAGCKIMPEFLEDDFAGNWRGVCRALSADEDCILEGTWRDEGCQIAKPAGCEDCDAVIDAKAGSVYCDGAAPACKYYSPGFSVMWPSIKAGCNATRENLKLASCRAKCGTVVEHKNIRARSCATLPVAIGGSVFSVGGMHIEAQPRQKPSFEAP
jgi:hypothetical protein